MLHLHIQLNASVLANEWGLLKKSVQPGFSFINMEAKISVFSNPVCTMGRLLKLDNNVLEKLFAVCWTVFWFCANTMRYDIFNERANVAVCMRGYEIHLQTI